MLTLIKSLVTASAHASETVATRVPDGERIYAVGDIHGRLDVFEDMIVAIDADDAARGPAATTVILLGDLIDRGPDSAGVLRSAREWAGRRRVRMVAGNHEEMLLGAFASDDVLRHFLRWGGKETLLSYPLDPATYREATLPQLRAMLPLLVPAEDVALISGMEDQIRVGDYLFVHAGIRPGVPLDAQHPADLRWIREEFLGDRTPRDFVVVHGHTIRPEPELEPWRIGIDTGAYASGVLTALGLEGEARWLVQVCAEA